MNPPPPHFWTQVGIGIRILEKPEKCPTIRGKMPHPCRYLEAYLQSGLQ